MTVSLPFGDQVIGSIKQKWHPLFPVFEIQDATGNTVLNIKGPFCTFDCFGEVEFSVNNSDGVESGKIKKLEVGCCEMFCAVEADDFAVNFSKDLEVNTKACLLAVVMLIDFVYFSDANQRRRRK